MLSQIEAEQAHGFSLRFVVSHQTEEWHPHIGYHTGMPCSPKLKVKSLVPVEGGSDRGPPSKLYPDVKTTEAFAGGLKKKKINSQHFA